MRISYTTRLLRLRCRGRPDGQTCRVVLALWEHRPRAYHSEDDFVRHLRCHRLARLHGFLGKPVAIDFTIFTRPLTEVFGSKGDVLDRAATAKHVKYDGACAEAAWKMLPFPCDTYGALHPDARHVVSKVIRRLVEARSGDLSADSASLATNVWRAVTAAVVSRAAVQLARHAAVDSPAGLPVSALAASVLPSTSPEESALVSLPTVLGTSASTALPDGLADTATDSSDSDGVPLHLVRQPCSLFRERARRPPTPSIPSGPPGGGHPRTPHVARRVVGKEEAREVPLRVPERGSCCLFVC